MAFLHFVAFFSWSAVCFGLLCAPWDKMGRYHHVHVFGHIRTGSSM